MALNGDVLDGRVDIRMNVRSSATICTIMYCEETAGPRNANVCMHMHIDKVQSSAYFHPNPQRL